MLNRLIFYLNKLISLCLITYNSQKLHKIPKHTKFCWKFFFFHNSGIVLQIFFIDLGTTQFPLIIWSNIDEYPSWHYKPPFLVKTFWKTIFEHFENTTFSTNCLLFATRTLAKKWYSSLFIHTQPVSSFYTNIQNRLTKCAPFKSVYSDFRPFQKFIIACKTVASSRNHVGSNKKNKCYLFSFQLCK